jgi:hypothetical protein
MEASGAASRSTWEMGAKREYVHFLPARARDDACVHGISPEYILLSFFILLFSIKPPISIAYFLGKGENWQMQGIQEWSELYVHQAGR